MCFGPFAPRVPASPPLPSAPRRDANAALVQSARLRARSARGVDDNIFTTALGDTNYGKSVRRAVLLGQSITAPVGA